MRSALSSCAGSASSDYRGGLSTASATRGLRHTWATLALEQGIHPRVVQERLGHSPIAITLGIYSHVSPTLHDEAAAAFAACVLDMANSSRAE
jgi:integrase